MKKKTSQRSLFNGRLMLLSKLFLVGIFLISQLGAYAQEKTVSGTVVGDDGVAIPGVTVIVKGTTKGSVTNVDGEYNITDVPDKATLLFSFVGLRTKEVVVGDQAKIDIAMEADAIGIDEVVAIGYGTSRKEDLTGSIVNVKAEDLEKYQPTNVQEMLRTSVAGLQVGYSTSAKNSPDFNIRGDNTIKADNDDGDGPEREANKPLIVLDGVIFNGDVAEINVNDIESVDVLKDASAAAIYGARASNGVIVFTTKKGATGKPVVRASAKLGIITGAKRMESFKAGDEVTTWLTDMNESINSLVLDPWSKYEQYEKVPAQYQSDWLVANGIPGATDPNVITTAWLDAFGLDPDEKDHYLNGRSYDWQDFLFHTGLRQDYDVSISGKANAVTYYWSVGYLNSESVQVGEKFSSLTSRLNMDVKAADWLNLGINANFAYQNEGDQPIDNGGYYTASPYDTPWENIVWSDTSIEDNGEGSYPDRFPREYLKQAGSGSNRGNPYLNPAYMTRQYEWYKLTPTMYAKLTLPFGITFTSNMTTRLDFRQRLYYEDSANPAWSHGGYARRQHNTGFEWQSNNILNWNKSFGEHRFDVTGLYNAEKNQMYYTQALSSNMSPTEALGFHALQFGLIPQVTSTDEVITRNALMGRVNYSYGNRYNFSASIRRDGYSRFGAENVYGTFPSLSAAWNMTNETFMADRPGWLSFLKLRGSWGVNGNSSGLGSYAAYATLSNNKYLNYNGGYFVAPYLYINRMANPSLSWEKNQGFNFGLDYGLWDGRLRGALDVYSSRTVDLLLDKKLPIVTGFESITTNVGELKNTGFELSINSINIKNSDFIWTSQLNLSYNKNKIVSLTGEKVAVTDENGNVTMEEPDDISNGWFIGENKDVIWDYEIDGIYQLGEEAEAAVFGLYPGDFKYIDQDGNDVINSDDKIFQGLSRNPWYVTFRNDFEYKSFDLGIIFLGKLGYKGGTTWPFNNRQEYIKNHNWYNMPYWTPLNPINDAARINSINLGGANVWIPKSYVRLQNIALGYNLPADILETIKVSRARVAFNIDNVGMVTKWQQGDPESEREMPRTYSFSVDFSF